MAAWCDVCDRPVETDVCEVCGTPVQAPHREPVPWRWRFFIVASVIYLAYRIYQIISWIVH